MTVRLVALAAILMAPVSPALAAATKAQMNIVPAKADCFTPGNFCVNNGAFCAMPDNSDCTASGMSPSSKFKIDETLVLKGTIKKVTDNSATLVTTGAEGAADNFIFKLTLTVCVVDNGPPSCQETENIYVKVVLNNGNGKMNVDLGPVLTGLGIPVTSGDPLMIGGGGLLAPATVGCAGDNSAPNISARLNDGNCESGNGVYGVNGFAAQ